MSNTPKKTRLQAGRDKAAAVVQRQESSVSDPGLSAGPAGLTSPSVISAVERAVIERILRDDVLAERIISGLIDKVSARVVEGLAASLDFATKQIAELKSEIVVLKEQLRERDVVTANRIDDLEQYQRRNNLRIFGIPESSGEDTDKIVMDLCKEKLKLEITSDRIERSHRVGAGPTPAGSDTRPRAILVRFTSYRDRRAVFVEKRQLKGTGIVVREDLTRKRMELFRSATQKFGHRSVWTVDGRIHWVDSDGKRGTAIHDI
jgi:hypothetical protein